MMAHVLASFAAYEPLHCARGRSLTSRS
jgi:hypothetical protein